MRLSEYTRSRDNNFTLLRLIAACVVVVMHSAPVLGIVSSDSVFEDRLGRPFVGMAVDMFFALSGFLVTSSLLRRGDLNHFLWARALRLFPALWLMMPLTVFLLAPMVTALPAGDYYAAKGTWEYFWHGSTIVWGMRYHLPGVFETAPLKGEVNGSLWTLPVEARMYAYLAIGWFALSFMPSIRVRALSIIAPLIAVGLLIPVWRARAHGTMGNADIAVFMFFYGASLYFWRDRLFLNLPTFAALPIFAIGASILGGREVAFAVYLLCLPPFLLHLAYIPGGPIRKVNRWGDYSYGIYIYAFPVQQTLAHLFPKLPLSAMVVGATGISWALAWCSWNLVERRAIKLKDACADGTARAWHAVRDWGLVWAPRVSLAGIVEKATPRPNDGFERGDRRTPGETSRFATTDEPAPTSAIRAEG